jgi:hypothetical protein
LNTKKPTTSNTPKNCNVTVQSGSRIEAGS